MSAQLHKKRKWLRVTVTWDIFRELIKKQKNKLCNHLQHVHTWEVHSSLKQRLIVHQTSNWQFQIVTRELKITKLDFHYWQMCLDFFYKNPIIIIVDQPTLLQFSLTSSFQIKSKPGHSPRSCQKYKPWTMQLIQHIQAK